MNDGETDRDQTEEEYLTFEVTDEALEAVAAMGIGGNQTLAVGSCCFTC